MRRRYGVTGDIVDIPGCGVRLRLMHSLSLPPHSAVVDPPHDDDLNQLKGETRIA
jgi:hypothetical protein